MKCPYCHQEHPDEALFCPVTGGRFNPSKSLRIRRLVAVFISLSLFVVAAFLIANQFDWRLGKRDIQFAVLKRTPEPVINKKPIEEVECRLLPKSETAVTSQPSSSSINPNGYTVTIPFLTIPPTYPHWVTYIRSILESQYDAKTFYESRHTVHSTLDPVLQELAQQIIQEHLNTLQDRHVTNAALVAIRPATGEILAMVGSADFFNEAIGGQINMSLVPRQPGTSIKPITYLAAFEKGWTPATLIWDVNSEFPPSGDPNDLRAPYIPVNYDERYHGPVTVRSALANSYNIPAVKALQYVGIYDNPSTPEEDGLLAMARRLGIESLNRNDYGLSLTLGGGEVTLLEMVAAFSVLANGGVRVPPVAITSILDDAGNVIYEYQPPDIDQVVRPEHAYLITDILSDNHARTPAFGPNSTINLPFITAVKTGTTNDFRDNWTIGYTPDIVVGVWVGNADYSSMEGMSGLTGAAPIWAEFMKAANQHLSGGIATPFNRPAGIVECVICAVSGTGPSTWCPNQRSEFFAADQLPVLKAYDLWQKASIDTWTGLLSSVGCPDFSEEKMALNIQDPWAVKWVRETDQGATWAQQMGFESPIFFTPEKACEEGDPRPFLFFIHPEEGVIYTDDNISIAVIADASAWFKHLRLEYGSGKDPDNWILLTERDLPVKQPEEIYLWDLSEMPEGELTLRLFMESTEGTYAEKRLYLEVHE